MYDLNDESYDSNKPVAIFNGGDVGLVPNVTITVEKKPADETKNTPSWKIFFTDATGASTNNGLYYLDPSQEYFDQQRIRQGQVLKHLLKVIANDDNLQLPSFTNGTEMLDQVMEAVAKKAVGKTFSVWANYGSTKKPSKFISVRTWVPFMATAANAEERLVPSNSDNTVRLVEDQPAAAPAESTTGGTDASWMDE